MPKTKGTSTEVKVYLAIDQHGPLTANGLTAETGDEVSPEFLDGLVEKNLLSKKLDPEVANTPSVQDPHTSWLYDFT